MKRNILEQLETKFSKFVIDITRRAKVLHHNFVLSDQLLRSGTSILANTIEASVAQSRKDFVSKLCIARKELRETQKWMELFEHAGYSASPRSSSSVL